MRRLISGLLVALVLGLWGFAGCKSSSDTSTQTPNCQGLLEPGDCFQCLENNCCGPLAGCLQDSGCGACVAGTKTACNSATWLALYQCSESSCSTQCGSQAIEVADCSATAAPASKGACVSLTQHITCNPFTNEPCDTKGGEACDDDPSAGVVRCFPPTPPNDRDLCEDCGPSTDFCKPGLTCIQSLSITEGGVSINGKCARFCCDDSDCGKDGVCGRKTTIDGKTAGACISKSGSSGSGGGGGTGVGGASAGSGGSGGSGGV